MRRSAAILDEAFARLAEEQFVGRTERDIVWRMAELIHEGGADDVGLLDCRGLRTDGRVAARRAGDRRIEVGETVVVDAGCRVNGYCSDCTRTFATGSLPAELAEAYAVVLRAQLARSTLWCRVPKVKASTTSPARSSRRRASAIASATVSVTVSAWRCTRRRGSTPSWRETPLSPATSSRSSRASTCRAWAVFASKTS